MRLDKLLSNLKYGSRKEIKELIKKRLVTVNGTLCKQSDVEIDPNHDTIMINNIEVYYRESLILMVHKPKGYLSANHDNLHKTVFSFVPNKYLRLDLKMAGRLDIDASGIMLLTNDGSIAHQLTHPRQHVDKTYEVTLNKVIDEKDIKPLYHGVELKDEDGSTYIGVAKYLTFEGKVAQITIDQGRFHQVKKMFKAVGYEVLELKRITYGKLNLDIEEGDFREVSLSEII